MASCEDGVYELITELCQTAAKKYCSQRRISQNRLVSKLRSHSYGIILNKSSKEYAITKKEPITHLLTYCFMLQQNTKNVIEYKRSVELKKIINEIRKTDYGEQKELINTVLRLLVSLCDTVKEDLSSEVFKNPFTFGLLDSMLPKPEQVAYGSPQPYPLYPPHVFELPYSLKHQASMLQDKLQTYTDYSVESFNSKSLLQDNPGGGLEVKTFLSPMSLASLKSSNQFPYSELAMPNTLRLSTPRDIKIPSADAVDVNISLASSKTEVKEVFKAQSDRESVDIWELASQLDKDIPDDIWEIVAKLEPINERQLIASSKREMLLWREKYGGEICDLDIKLEKQFIRHIMFLIIGIETSCFPFSPELNRFFMKEDIILECISKEHLRGYISSLLIVGTYYMRLYNFAFTEGGSDNFTSKGLIYEAAREVIRQYLLEFRLLATELYEECTKNRMTDLNCMPTLLQILYHMEPLKYEIETVATIYKMTDAESVPFPCGAELMSYLFNQISLVTHKKTAFTMFNSLLTICTVYFKFIERFIFEGELDDVYNEFFIRKDNQYVNCRAKRYWDKGFHINQGIPDFLRPLTKLILLCGKSLRLLKLCNPSDPLVLLISSDHPSIKCCASFDELERQQQLLDVYRTRCLFVSGEPVTFDQILLKREAENKAFTEMASLKQAETLEKIIAERKRLAQLIIAEKQHSLRVLEAAMAEAKAAKKRAKDRERKRNQLERDADAASEEVDARLRDDERKKIMEYYSKLNMEVEKSKIHTEWKIKRLQLDQSRIQLLSTEERNLKREKLELEHQRNEEIMAMSIQSFDSRPDDDKSSQDGDVNTCNENLLDSTSSVVLTSSENIDANKDSNQTHTMLTAICNAAKSIFGVSWSGDDRNCDNENKTDSQGNVIVTNIDNAVETKKEMDATGDVIDNNEYFKVREEALRNRKKVMSHETHKENVDVENNQLKSVSSTFDQDNNNLNYISSANSEAQKNKLKVLGTDFDIVKIEDSKPILTLPRTDAQKEALRNKQKVLGVEYNIPTDFNLPKPPVNFAQEEALRNRDKVLGSEYEIRLREPIQREPSKRSGLTLNLKPSIDTSPGSYFGVTPNTGAITPAEFFPRLDIETPTADVPLEGQITSEILCTNHDSNLADVRKTKSDKFLTSEGFNFSLIEDDENVDADSEIRAEDSPDCSPAKKDISVRVSDRNRSFLALQDGSYNFDNLDPFRVKDLKNYSKDHFTSQMDLDMRDSCYTHPSIIMEEVKKTPYSNIFAYFTSKEEVKKVNCDNIATLTACLQRSVLLPLTYQLEVVNNATLTYYLVNLEMYEHLRSLKDYFFLMDGEFSRSICRNLFAKLGQTINPQELLNFATLHNILDKALGSSISHVHKFSENLSFSISEWPLSFQQSSPDVLRCLSLSYAVQWPLNILLSQEALLRYDKVFQFLLKMRRVSWLLGEDFENLKLKAKLLRHDSRKLLKSPEYISIQIYRHIMASMMRALDSYIVTTCILTSWREFENDLKKARTLDDLYECHVAYIKKVLFRCLLNNRSTPVMKLLNDIFTVILKFSRVLKAGEWQQKDHNTNFTHTNYSQLEELFHLFEKLNKYLHKVITKLMECGYQRHLVELLTMVNYNGYYYDTEKSKDDTNASL